MSTIILCSLVSLILFLKKFKAFFLLIFFVFLKVPAIGLVDIDKPFFVIKFSGEQLIIEKSLSLIIKASGAKFDLASLQKKSKGSIFELFLYFVHILIWYVSPDFIFFLNMLKIFVYEF